MAEEVTLVNGDKERLAYWKPSGTDDRSLFVHEHIPHNSASTGILFLNPILDEKKRSQRFQAQTARLLCEAGMTVIRFDYFGTGDSFGASYDFDLKQCLHDAFDLVKAMSEQHRLNAMHVVGIRAGADLALMMANRDPALVNDLHLVEPLVDGRRYLMEQRIRRKAFFKLNELTVDDQITIQGQPYEDHQGFPLSKSVLSFLEQMNGLKLNVKDKKMHVYKSLYLGSEKPIEKLVHHLDSLGSAVEVHSVPVREFWSSMDPLPTTELSRKILQKLTTQN